MGKASVRRRVTRKRKLNRKNKKTQRKGLKQRGGRRRPNGLETAGGGASAAGGGSTGNGENYEKYIRAKRKEEQAYEKMREEAYERIKPQAIKLIQDEAEPEQLRALLEEISLPNDDLLIASVKVEKPNIDIIRELISVTEIVDATHHDISRILEKNPELLTKVFDLLEEQEERQKEEELLANAEPNYASHAAAAGGPPRAVANLVASAQKALAEMPPRRRLRRL